eukprot:6758473-Pyramimonas_sp.AAC.1
MPFTSRDRNYPLALATQRNARGPRAVFEDLPAGLAAARDLVEDRLRERLKADGDPRWMLTELER